MKIMSRPKDVPGRTPPTTSAQHPGCVCEVEEWNEDVENQMVTAVVACKENDELKFRMTVRDTKTNIKDRIKLDFKEAFNRWKNEIAKDPASEMGGNKVFNIDETTGEML